MNPIYCIMGTRPEIIKMAPVVHALRKAELPVDIVLTNQHEDLAGPMMDLFDLVPDHTFDDTGKALSLGARAGIMLAECSTLITRERPSMVVAQGDTTTTAGAAHAAFLARIPFAHVEAGLRSHDMNAPFPEEANRIIADTLATLHFAPTVKNEANLACEGHIESVHVVGNTGIDSLLQVIRNHVSVLEKTESPCVLITCHRRESFGARMNGIFEAIFAAARSMPMCLFLHIDHPNPAIREALAAAGEEPVNFQHVPPMAYPHFIEAMMDSTVILSDSGGIQEEAAFLGKRVLLLRETTERPEGVYAGVSKIVGYKPDDIIDAIKDGITDPSVPETARWTFGDGHSAERIAKIIKGELSK